jgi:hypothetical protein
MRRGEEVILDLESLDQMESMKKEKKFNLF